MSVIYEKGSSAWDISMVLTRHGDGYTKNQHGDFAPCARVLELRRTARDHNAAERLRKALVITCSCGAGDSPAEQTSITNNQQEDNDHETSTSETAV